MLHAAEGGCHRTQRWGVGAGRTGQATRRQDVRQVVPAAQPHLARPADFDVVQAGAPPDQRVASQEGAGFDTSSARLNPRRVALQREIDGGLPFAGGDLTAASGRATAPV